MLRCNTAARAVPARPVRCRAPPHHRLSEFNLKGGYVQDLSVHQAVGLMASLVWREKTDTSARVSAELEGPIGALREAAKRVAKVRDIRLCFGLILLARYPG